TIEQRVVDETNAAIKNAGDTRKQILDSSNPLAIGGLQANVAAFTKGITYTRKGDLLKAIQEMCTDKADAAHEQGKQLK
ncbi:unnamed protein product, partial [Amoebophrya sp. A25]